MFVVIGVLSTLAYGLLYLLFRQATSPQAANALALVCTAVANTAANRRWTFGHRGPRSRLRHQAQGLVVFGLGLGVTSGTLWLVEPLAAGMSAAAGHLVEVVSLTVANLLVTVSRFAAMRWWIFRR
jgi:putative flippase GtrA